MNAIFIEWIDCAQLEGWQEIPKGFEPSTIRTIAWMVSETDDAVTVASSFQEGDPVYHGVLCIPKRAIVARRLVV